MYPAFSLNHSATHSVFLIILKENVLTSYGHLKVLHHFMQKELEILWPYRYLKEKIRLYACTLPHTGLRGLIN